MDTRRIEISETAYRALADRHGDVAAYVEKIAGQGQPSNRRTAADLVGQFREFRGMLKGSSVSEIVQSRHAGLR